MSACSEAQAGAPVAGGNSWHSWRKRTPAPRLGQPVAAIESPLTAQSSLNWWLRQPAITPLHHESLIKRVPFALDVRRRSRAVVTHVISNQCPCDTELHVRFKFFIVIYIDLRNQGFEALLEDQEVQMSGAVVVPPGGTHEVADRPINGNGIAGRLNAAKAEMTMGVCHKFSSQIHRCLFGILLLVEPFR